MSAQFNVPLSTCTTDPSAAYVWVGLDGWNDKTVEQAGVAAYCSGGTVQYFDWYEMYPDGLVEEYAVNPGDTIVASADYNPTKGKYYLDIVDKNNSAANFNAVETCPSGSTCNKSSAEVITEDPGGGPADGFYLANFHYVDFSNAKVSSRSGLNGTLQSTSEWTADKITMEYPGTTVMVQAGARSAGATAFTDTYESDG